MEYKPGNYLWITACKVVYLISLLIVVALLVSFLFEGLLEGNERSLCFFIAYVALLFLTRKNALIKMRWSENLAAANTIALCWLWTMLFLFASSSLGFSDVFNADMFDSDETWLFIGTIVLNVVCLVVRFRKPKEKRRTKITGKPYVGADPYIFISYAHKDINKVSEIIEKLNSEGYNIWYDDGIDPGTEWADNIASHLMGSSFFIAFISENYLNSSNCKDELNMARDDVEKTLLVYLDAVELPNGIKLRNNRFQSIFRYKYVSPEIFYSKLFNAEGIEKCKSNSEKKKAPKAEENG